MYMIKGERVLVNPSFEEMDVLLEKGAIGIVFDNKRKYTYVWPLEKLSFLNIKEFCYAADMELSDYYYFNLKLNPNREKTILVWRDDICYSYLSEKWSMFESSEWKYYLRQYFISILAGKPE